MPNPLPDPITMTHDAICLATHMFLGWAFGVRWNSISRWFWVGSVKLLTAALMLYVLHRTFRTIKRKIPSTILAARKAAACYFPYLLGWLAPPEEDTDIPGVIYMCQREKRLVLKVNGWDEVYLDQAIKMPADDLHDPFFYQDDVGPSHCTPILTDVPAPARDQTWARPLPPFAVRSVPVNTNDKLDTKPNKRTPTRNSGFVDLAVLVGDNAEYTINTRMSTYRRSQVAKGQAKIIVPAPPQDTGFTRFVPTFLRPVLRFFGVDAAAPGAVVGGKAGSANDSGDESAGSPDSPTTSFELMTPGSSSAETSPLVKAKRLEHKGKGVTDDGEGDMDVEEDVGV